MDSAQGAADEAGGLGLEGGADGSFSEQFLLDGVSGLDDRGRRLWDRTLRFRPSVEVGADVRDIGEHRNKRTVRFPITGCCENDTCEEEDQREAARDFHGEGRLLIDAGRMKDVFHGRRGVRVL